MICRRLTSSYKLFENVFPALFWAGLFVNAAILFDEKYMEEHSCSLKDYHYFEDVGKQLFWAVFFIRLLLKPFIEKILERATLGSSPSKETVSRLETEINDGLETALFVFESVNATSVPYSAAMLIALPSVWPIFSAFYKFYDARFIRGPKVSYAIYDAKKRYAFTLMESLYNTLSLSSATSFVLSLLFNVFYDSTHEQSFAYQNHIIWPLIFISGFLGACSVLNEKAWEAMRASEVLINTFFYSFNMSISSVNCLFPHSFTDSGFIKTGWIYAAVLGVLSMGLSSISVSQDSDNPYANEMSEKKKDLVAFKRPGESWFFRLFHDPDYVSIKTVGCSCLSYQGKGIV